MRLRLEGADELVREIEGRAARAIRRPWEIRLREVLAAARAQWPVRTGRSRRRLQGRVFLTTTGVTVEAVNDVDYATEIHDGETWRALVVAPVLRLGREEVSIVERAVADAVGGRR